MRALPVNRMHNAALKMPSAEQWGAIGHLCHECARPQNRHATEAGTPIGMGSVSSSLMRAWRAVRIFCALSTEIP